MQSSSSQESPKDMLSFEVTVTLARTTDAMTLSGPSLAQVLSLRKRKPQPPAHRPLAIGGIWALLAAPSFFL